MALPQTPSMPRTARIRVWQRQISIDGSNAQLQEQLLPNYKQSRPLVTKGQVNGTLEVRDQKLRYWLRISVLYRAEPKLSLLVQIQAPVVTKQKFISDCRYRVIESSSLVSILFREVFSHPYISFFHLLVNGYCVTCFHTF